MGAALGKFQENTEPAAADERKLAAEIWDAGTVQLFVALFDGLCLYRSVRKMNLCVAGTPIFPEYGLS